MSQLHLSFIYNWMGVTEMFISYSFYEDVIVFVTSLLLTHNTQNLHIKRDISDGDQPVETPSKSLWRVEPYWFCRCLEGICPIVTLCSSQLYMNFLSGEAHNFKNHLAMSFALDSQSGDGKSLKQHLDYSLMLGWLEISFCRLINLLLLILVSHNIDRFSPTA